MIENVTLTMSHLGLGTLNEYALMVLFGNAHSNCLVSGTGVLPNQMEDKEAHILYPAYFRTLLKVPPSASLSSYGLWENVDVGVDVKRFGSTILESSYVLGPKGKTPKKVSDWDNGKFPFMQGSNLIVVDNTEENTTTRRVSNPKKEHIADLPSLKKVPQAVLQAKKVRSEGFPLDGFVGNLKPRKPYSFPIFLGRDAAPGHAMIFAKFPEIMDCVEYQFLSQKIFPGFPSGILQHLTVLEREVYYYGNCYAGDTLEIGMEGEIRECPPDLYEPSSHLISGAALEFRFEIYQKKSNTLLAMGRVKKLIAIPTRIQDLIQDIQRLVSKFSPIN